MKKSNYLWALLLLLSGLCNEYLQAQVSVFVGPNVGYNGRAIINQNNYGQRRMDYTFAGAANYGISAGVDFNNKHILQVDASLIQLGQSYSHVFSGLQFDKEVELNYFQVPLTYRFVTGRKDKDFRKGTNFHLLVGAYIGFLQEANMSHSIEGADVSFFDFVTRGVVNPNLIVLNQRFPSGGSPSDYADLFTTTDFGAMIGFGLQSFLIPQLKLLAEVRLGISAQDINAERWRLINLDFNYNPSYNLFGGLNLGLVYYF